MLVHVGIAAELGHGHGATANGEVVLVADGRLRIGWREPERLEVDAQLARADVGVGRRQAAADGRASHGDARVGRQRQRARHLR